MYEHFNESEFNFFLDTIHLNFKRMFDIRLDFNQLEFKSYCGKSLKKI